MLYRVTFAGRHNQEGDPSDAPSSEFSLEVPDGVILDQRFVERLEPPSDHNEGRLDEDDDFLSAGSETWEYDVADERIDEFVASLKDSAEVMRWAELGDELSTPTPA